MRTFARRMAGAATIVTMGLALAACDAGTTEGGTAPGQELPADDGLGGDTGGDMGGAGDTGGDLGG